VSVVRFELLNPLTLKSPFGLTSRCRLYDGGRHKAHEQLVVVEEALREAREELSASTGASRAKVLVACCP
jgi:hypothetical protein